MQRQLRAAIGDLSIRERVALATVVTCNSGGAVADPEVCSGTRLSFLDPEPGDRPHSALVRCDRRRGLDGSRYRRGQPGDVAPETCASA
jgi:hypothetical protein